MADTIRTRLINKHQLSRDITCFQFAAIDTTFPPLESGSHIDFIFSPEFVRNYSIYDWDSEGKAISVAVKLEPEGCGGSRAMHVLQEGDEMTLSQPRNNFPLQADSDHLIVLIAGGIGVTPIYAMAAEMKARGRDCEVYYLVRSRELAAFDHLFQALNLGEHYHLHCDDTNGYLDFGALVDAYPADTDFYICGPEMLLGKLQDACKAHNRGTVYFERFAPLAAPADEVNAQFEVELDSSGEVFTIPADKTILAVLQEQGYTPQYGCISGICGACITDVLEGEVEHRDSVLEDEEKENDECMCICVSRAKSGRLRLDL